MATWQFAHLQNTAALHDWTKFVSMQNHYSLLYREEEREMIPYCKATGVGLIPWSPLARGHLARAQSADTVRRREHEPSAEAASKLGNSAYALGFTEIDMQTITRVEEVARKKGWSMASVALAWINVKVDSPIVGIGSIDRVVEGLEAATKRLDGEEVAYLEELYVPRTIMGH